MAGTRKDLAKLGQTWAPELLWYARAVGAMRGRTLADRTSWTYFAAIHGINAPRWVRDGIIAGEDGVPEGERNRMFNQCQHAGWFFLPWHRGYLWAFEAVIGDWIASNGGPTDWALPYWNYLDERNPHARVCPVEFLDPTLPDGSPNPLSQAVRGPARELGPEQWIPDDISLAVQRNERMYTADPGTLGYGGPVSGFAQQGDAFGGVESNPHNFVHLMIGGDASADPQGWMFDPAMAGLDPIFWMHHCNIDRLWAAWMVDPDNDQEMSRAWKNGPFPHRFAMPTTDGGIAVFTPADTLPGEPLAPTYDDLAAGTGLPAPSSDRSLVSAMTKTFSGGQKSSFLGASEQDLVVHNAPVRSELRLVPTARSNSLLKAASDGFRVYLNAEGVKGSDPSGVLVINLSRPGSDARGTKTMAFFGLANATAVDGPHGGGGLTGAVDVTDIVHELGVREADELGNLEVEVSQPVEGRAPITVGRLSLYARPG